LRALVVAALLVVWEIVTESGLISPLFLSPPAPVGGELVRGIRQGPLLSATLVTLYEVSITFLIVASVGVLFGYVLWRFGRLGAAYEPLLASAFASPVVLLYPLFFILLGRGRAAVVGQGVLLGAIPVILFTYRGLRDVRRPLLAVGRSNGLTGARLFRHVALPAASGSIFTGLRLGATYVLVSIIAVEYLGQTGGLGGTVASAALQFDTPSLYAAVVLVILITAAVLALTYRLEQIVRR